MTDMLDVNVNRPPAPPVGPQVYMRAFPIEDVRVLTRAQGSEYGDCRTVEALTAVFDQETPIVDGQGRYRETIDRTAFDRTIAMIAPQGSRANWKVGVFYNHGMTIHGTPSDTNSRPLGTSLGVRADTMGLVTITRYANTPLGEEILELIRSGAITGHSFTGRIMRSSPEPGRNGYRPDGRGELPLVRRLELGLREYGPTPFPAYDTTAVLSVRSFNEANEANFSASDTPTAEPSDAGTSSDEEPAPGDPPDPDEVEHSDRSHDEDRAVRHAALATRIAAARRARPGL